RALAQPVGNRERVEQQKVVAERDRVRRNELGPPLLLIPVGMRRLPMPDTRAQLTHGPQCYVRSQRRTTRRQTPTTPSTRDRRRRCVNQTTLFCRPPLALRPGEAAEALGCTRDFVDRHVGPELRWVRRGRLKFVAIAEIEDWLNRSAALTLD